MSPCTVTLCVSALTDGCVHALCVLQVFHPQETTYYVYSLSVAATLPVYDGVWFQSIPTLFDAPFVIGDVPEPLRLDVRNPTLRAFRATLYSKDGIVNDVEETNPTNWPSLFGSVAAWLGLITATIEVLFPRKVSVKAEVILHPTIQKLRARMARPRARTPSPSSKACRRTQPS